jgi:hypothetical protein
VDKVVEFLVQNGGPLLISLLGALAAWGLSKLKIQADLKTAIEVYTKRVLDKAGDWLKIATAPDSDGGVKITSAELSMIRQQVWDLMVSEFKDKGPLFKLLMSWGENFVKGLIGQALEKFGVKAVA